MGRAENIFYVTDGIGNHVDSKIIDSVRQKIGEDYLRVKELPLAQRNHQKTVNEEGRLGGAVLLSLGSLLRRNLYNLGLIKSFS